MPTTREEPIKGATPIKDASLTALENGGILNQGDAETIKDANDGNLKECIHNHPGGKGCYVCDPDPPAQAQGRGEGMSVYGPSTRRPGRGRRKS